MLSALRRCFTCRSCTDCSAPCCPRFKATMRLRSRSDTPSLDGVQANFLKHAAGQSAGGRLMTGLRKLLRSPTGQVPSTIDGHHSPTQEEPEVSQPEIAVPTFERYFDEQHLCEATELLIDREKYLFGEASLADCDEEITKLSADRAALKGLILHTVQHSLSLSPDEPNNNRMFTVTSTLESAVKAILQEEEQDQLWKHRGRSPPAWRPCDWRRLHDATLRALVEERMENHQRASTSSLPEEQSSIRADIRRMGGQVEEDLLQVVRVVRSCYPAQMDICNFYAAQYHRVFSDKLRNIAEFGLDDSDCTVLLRWVNTYYPEIFQEPELAANIDCSLLGKLLPATLLQPLEDQYLSNQQTELMTYMNRVLENAREKFNNSEEPEQEDGCYSSPVAYDIIQLVNGMVTSAEKTVGDRHKARSITQPLHGLMERFRLFQEDVSRQKRANSAAQIKANLSCIAQFGDVLIRKKHLFPQDLQENCLLVLNDMKQSAHAHLLAPVHKLLRPHYQKLGTSDWLHKNRSEKLLGAIEKLHQDLQGCSPSCNQELMGQLHQEVTEEYVRRLLKGDVKLKDREHQHKAYMTVRDDAESLHKLFSSMGSQEEWLNEILIKMAEVLKLQDVPAIQMQIASLGSDYPDLSERHVSALLKLKTNLCKADRRTIKATLTDTLKEAVLSADRRTFFSKVEVR